MREKEKERERKRVREIERKKERVRVRVREKEKERQKERHILFSFPPFLEDSLLLFRLLIFSFPKSHSMSLSITHTHTHKQTKKQRKHHIIIESSPPTCDLHCLHHIQNGITDSGSQIKNGIFPVTLNSAETLKKKKM